MDIDKIDPPKDYLTPRWGDVDRVHNWRNYATEELKTVWCDMSELHRAIVAEALDSVASAEYWD